MQTQINYIEFSAPDVEAVKRFYGAAFGWTFTDYGPDYVAFSDGKLEGGFERGTTRPPKGPLVILYTTELEALAEAVTRHGGTITEPIFPFPGGRRFHFLDTAGNELAAWSDA